MKLLFITRKYPPMVGGMEKLSYALANEFPKHVDTTTIAWGKTQKYLPYFLSKSFLQSLFIIPVKRITHVHLGDALLSPLGIILRMLFGVKATVTACGLDVTFNFLPYQLVIPACLKRLDKIICISNATLEECVKRGIPREKCVVIPCGVYPEDFQVKATKKDLEEIVGQSLEGKKVFITVGRLVERKGVYWFIKNVFTKLPENIIYLVIGQGTERERIEALISNLKLKKRILLLGKVTDEKLKIIYNTADLFIMPNINLKGDIEGFGIVATEASSTGLPVIAAKTGGITDAVINGKTGTLVQSGNSQSFVRAIENYKMLGKKTVLQETVKNFSWGDIGKEYIGVIQ